MGILTIKGARGIPRGFVVMVLADDETSMFDDDADADAAAEDMVQTQGPSTNYTQVKLSVKGG